MREQRISIQNEYNETLVGIQTSPEVDQSKLPTVILVHGFGVTKHEGGLFDEVAKRLAENGIMSFRCDFSGRGESEGDYSETSLTKLSSELGSIIDYVRGVDNVDTKRVGLLGQSLGTATILALRPDVKTIVLTASVSQPREILAELFGDGHNPGGTSEQSKSNGEVIKIKSQFWQDFDNHDLLANIGQFKCPIFFVHGSSDAKVPVSNMETLFENTKASKEKMIIEGVDHGFRPYRDQYYKAVVDWFGKSL